MRSESPSPYSNSRVEAVHRELRHYVFSTDEPVPSAKQLRTLLTNCFWASLKTEEGNYPRVRIAVQEPDPLLPCLVFGRPLPFSEHLIVKLSPLLRTRDAYLLVHFPKRSVPKVWAICEQLPGGLSVRSLGPGHIVLDINHEVVADIAPGTVPKFVGPVQVEQWASSITTFLSRGRSQSQTFSSIAGPLFYIARAMQQHGRGGTLILVPQANEAYVRKIDIEYSINSDRLNFGMRWRGWRKRCEKDSRRIWKESKLHGEPLIIFTPFGSPEGRYFRQAAHLVAMLTAVDGATIVSFDFSVIGFGAKLAAKGHPQKNVKMIDPTVDDGERRVRFSKIGGTRHRSAAQFVNDNPSALALVASQDGRLTLFANESGVRGLRCEALILGETLVL